MKSTNVLIVAALAFTALITNAEEVKIGKNTKVITPTKYIHVFDRIEWTELEKRHDDGKKIRMNYQLHDSC